MACEELCYVHPVWQILEPIPQSMSTDTWRRLTIWEFLAAPTILCVRVAAEHCFVQGMIPGTVVLTCEPCLAFLRTPSGSFRAGVPGRMVPTRFWRASQRRAVSRLPASPSHGVRVGGGPRVRLSEWRPCGGSRGLSECSSLLSLDS